MMRTLICWRWLGVLAVPLLLIALGCTDVPDTSRQATSLSLDPPAPPTSAKKDTAAVPAVQMKELKLAKYDDMIKKHRGKVVLVDFWQDFCIPCKAGFPHLVKLYEKHDKDGFVVVTINLDHPKDQKSLLSAFRFLQQQNAAFPNYTVDSEETPKGWNARFDIATIPHKLLYDREGRLVKLSQRQIHEELDEQINNLLKK
jgi:thiol-disulfide isomerase/thioredoxin